MGLLDFLKKDKTKQVEEVSRDMTGREAIDAVLNRMAEERGECLLLLGREVFRSSFIAIDDETFALDLMIPLAGNTLLSQGQGLRIHFIMDDSPYQMYCTFAGRQRSDNHDSLSFNKPVRIIHVDRRERSRVKPEDDRGIRVYFDLGATSVSDVVIENISATGLAIRSSLTESMRSGAVIDRIEILLPDTNWITCSGVVRRIRGEVLGIELQELSSHQRELLQKFVEKTKQGTESETE